MERSGGLPRADPLTGIDPGQTRDRYSMPHTYHCLYEFMGNILPLLTITQIFEGVLKFLLDKFFPPISPLTCGDENLINGIFSYENFCM